MLTIFKKTTPFFQLPVECSLKKLNTSRSLPMSRFKRYLLRRNLQWTYITTSNTCQKNQNIEKWKSYRNKHFSDYFQQPNTSKIYQSLWCAMTANVLDVRPPNADTYLTYVQTPAALIVISNIKVVKTEQNAQNCSGDHLSFSKECPTWKLEKRTWNEIQSKHFILVRNCSFQKKDIYLYNKHIRIYCKIINIICFYTCGCFNTNDLIGITARNGS